MLTTEEFHAALGTSTWLLDGATGSWLRKKGMPRDCSTEEWVLRNPEVLVQLQRGYAQAGSKIIYAPTFQAAHCPGKNRPAKPLRGHQRPADCPDPLRRSGEPGCR